MHVIQDPSRQQLRPLLVHGRSVSRIYDYGFQTALNKIIYRARVYVRCVSKGVRCTLKLTNSKMDAENEQISNKLLCLLSTLLFSFCNFIYVTQVVEWVYCSPPALKKYVNYNETEWSFESILLAATSKHVYQILQIILVYIICCF